MPEEDYDLYGEDDSQQRIEVGTALLYHKDVVHS